MFKYLFKNCSCKNENNETKISFKSNCLNGRKIVITFNENNNDEIEYIF